MNLDFILGNRQERGKGNLVVWGVHFLHVVVRLGSDDSVDDDRTVGRLFQVRELGGRNRLRGVPISLYTVEGASYVP